MTLSVNLLFQPAPSGVGPYGTANGATVGVVPQVPGYGSWLATMLQVAATVQLPTTSWQPGDPERTIFATEAVCFSLSDAVISQMAQGSFLQSAASGTVTYTTPEGVTVVIPVTPDPSNAAQNPTGAPGYEDLLAQNVYNVTRLQATNVTGPLAIAKLSAGTIGPYAAGAYHVGGPPGGATYHNELSFSIPSSIIPGNGGTITGVTPGIAFTTIATLTAHGLTPGQVVYIVIPTSSGITGLNGVFATITGTPTSTTYVISPPNGSGGTYSSGGITYLCSIVQMVADVAGIGSNAGPYTVTTAITQNTNVFVSNVTGWSGSNYESNQALAARCQLSLASRSPNGPSQSYTYFAETAEQILAAEEPPLNFLVNGPVRAINFSIPRTGSVITVVGSQSPLNGGSVYGANVTPGVSQLPITGIILQNPTIINCTGPTGLTTGQSFIVSITGVLGPLSVNGKFLGTYVSANSFSIPIDTTLEPAYFAGGSVEGGDLGQIDVILQQNCVPDNTTAFTFSALALPIQVTATVAVPQAFVTTYQAAVNNQLQNQIASYAIGGNAPDYQVSYDDIVGALTEAGVQTLGQASIATVQSLSINSQGLGQGVAFPSPFFMAVLFNPLITVLGI
jgi:hypothetical protein